MRKGTFNELVIKTLLAMFEKLQAIKRTIILVQPYTFVSQDCELF